MCFVHMGRLYQLEYTLVHMPIACISGYIFVSTKGFNVVLTY